MAKKWWWGGNDQLHRAGQGVRYHHAGINCKTYVGPTSKPTGLLHKYYGEGNGMYFGLLTGSYIKNTQGGVLRRALGSIESELNADGTYKSSSTTYKLNGIISTDRLRIDGFNYSSQAYIAAMMRT